LAEKVHPQGRWLAPLPAKRNNRHALGFNVLANVRLKDFVSHPPFQRVWIEVLFFDVEAVLAVQIANRSGRLRHEVEAVGLCFHLAANFWVRVHFSSGT
jgi:hypothetical protein